MPLIRFAFVFGSLVVAAACSVERGDDDGQALAAGAAIAGTHGEFGNAAGSVSVANAGASAGTGGRGGAGVGGGVVAAGSGGDAGSGDDSGGEPVVIITSSCPTIDTEIADGSTAPGFAVLFELEDIDIFGKVGNVELAPEHVYFLSDGEIRRVPKAGGA